MSDEQHADKLNLSGYLPGTDRDGLTRRAGALVEAFRDAERNATDRGAATEVVVIGTMRGQSIRIPRDDEAPYTIEVRFTHVEVVEGPEAEQVRAMLTRIADARAGADPLPYPEGDDGEPEVPDSPADLDAKRNNRGGRGGKGQT